MLRGLLCLALAAAAALISQAAAADRLVLRDGSIIETRGSWQVKGRQVVFHLPNGTLSSVRLEAVDLKASKPARREHEAAKGNNPEAGTSHARPEPVMVITDRDIKRAVSPVTDDEDSASPPADGNATGGGDESRVVIEAQHLVVSSYEVNSSPRGGLEITGMLLNRGERIVAGAEVSVSVRAGDGVERSYLATISEPTLGVGGRSPFRILLPDVVALDDESLEFGLRGKAVRPRILGSAQTEPEEDLEPPPESTSGQR